VHGLFSPREGHRFDASKLLLDPYARVITGPITWNAAQISDARVETRDSTACMPHCVVIDPAFTWGDDRRLRTPWTQTVIYECHVKGMTMRHPGVPPELRGTYLGLASDAILDHLTSLGVTAVELLPIHHGMTDRHLAESGLTNYWGYNSIGFFAPDSRFATSALGAQVSEFKSMVKALHRAGLEVILDVVLNHTGEGNHLGPTLCFRGIDNLSYYDLQPEDRSQYRDFTGCGNSLAVTHPRVLQLVLDCLRYWVQEMHVDGFRFDLATTLARGPDGFDERSAFLTCMAQDPCLRDVKLIAEPWDLGPGGYQLGRFPGAWAEWNDRFRDTVRRFWRGDLKQVPELASRLAGSSDLFQTHDRRPHASINYVTCHDGFTLRDLVSYSTRHNEANREDNRDGASESFSHGWGAEGETDAEPVLALRERIQRSMLATLAFSQGVPMLSHGDEIGRTQRGNNNAYCQDNELSWIDWQLGPRERELLELTRRALHIRRENPVFRRRHFFAGDPVHPEAVKDVTWVRSSGDEMTLADWEDPENHVLGALLPGDASAEVDEQGRSSSGATLLLLLNASPRVRAMRLPELTQESHKTGPWIVLLDTGRDGVRKVHGTEVKLSAHSLLLLRHERAE